MPRRDEIVQYLNDRLDVDSFEDFSANGLQVQGRESVSKIAMVTDAAMATFRRAKEEACDMVVAHHGIIWGDGLRSITGRDYTHVRYLIENNLNLYAAHLPLDAHQKIGNNAELARVAGIADIEPFGKYHGQALGVSGVLPRPMGLDELAVTFKAEIDGEPTSLPFGPSVIKTVGIVSGGGSGALDEAIVRGMDCFVTGEGKHEDHHKAVEGNINVLYLGHYHSETGGVRALGRELERRFEVECVFIDEPTLI